MGGNIMIGAMQLIKLSAVALDGRTLAMTTVYKPCKHLIWK
jgi:hypothetical protein